MTMAATTTRSGSTRCRPGRRTASVSSASARCSRCSATRSARTRRSTSSARRASRQRRGRLPPRFARTPASPPPPTPRRTSRAGTNDSRPTSAGFEAAVERVRRESEAVGATQFEVLTAAALTDFAARGVEVAVVEAGLGGRHDATNVRRCARRPAHEHRARAHGGARHHANRDRGREARRGARGRDGDPARPGVRPARSCRRGEARWRSRGGRGVSRNAPWNGLSKRRSQDAWSFGRMERCVTVPTPPMRSTGSSRGFQRRAATSSSRRSSPTRTSTGSSSGLPAPGACWSPPGRRTNAPCRPPRSPNGPAGGSRAVEAVDDPRAALGRARELGGPVLVTGSLYLLADLSRER